MPIYKELTANSFALVTGDYRHSVVTVDAASNLPTTVDVVVPASSIALRTDDELAVIGLFRVVDPAVPEDHVVTSRTVSRVNGKVVAQITTALNTESLKGYARAKRSALIESGVTYAENTWASSDGDFAKIGQMLAYLTRQDTKSGTINSLSWETLTGYATVTASDLTSVSDLIATRNDSARRIEQTAITSIDNGTISSRAQIDALNWPTS